MAIRPFLRHLICLTFLFGCGCASSSIQAPLQQDLQPASPADEIAGESVTPPASQKPVPPKQSRQTANKTRTEEKQKSSNLLECDETCRATCSSKKQSPPKWCVLYEKPRD